MKIYIAIYCSDTIDGSNQVLSIHKTKEGAQKALLMHKEQMRQEFSESHNLPYFPFGTYENWFIQEKTLQE